MVPPVRFLCCGGHNGPLIRPKRLASEVCPDDIGLRDDRQRGMHPPDPRRNRFAEAREHGGGRPIWRLHPVREISIHAHLRIPDITEHARNLREHDWRASWQPDRDFITLSHPSRCGKLRWEHEMWPEHQDAVIQVVIPRRSPQAAPIGFVLIAGHPHGRRESSSSSHQRTQHDLCHSRNRPDNRDRLCAPIDPAEPNLLIRDKERTLTQIAEHCQRAPSTKEGVHRFTGKLGIGPYPPNWDRRQARKRGDTGAGRGGHS